MTILAFIADLTSGGQSFGEQHLRQTIQSGLQHNFFKMAWHGFMTGTWHWYKKWRSRAHWSFLKLSTHPRTCRSFRVCVLITYQLKNISRFPFAVLRFITLCKVKDCPITSKPLFMIEKRYVDFYFVYKMHTIFIAEIRQRCESYFVLFIIELT